MNDANSHGDITNLTLEQRLDLLISIYEGKFSLSKQCLADNEKYGGLSDIEKAVVWQTHFDYQQILTNLKLMKPEKDGRGFGFGVKVSFLK
jgi:hypothetical protein